MANIFAPGGQELALAKDIVRPNLLANSKKCEMRTPAGNIQFGKFITLSPNYSGSIYLSDADVNKGIKKGGTTYLPIAQNTYYTQTLWFTTDAQVISSNFPSNFLFYSSNSSLYPLSSVEVHQIVGNQYKVSGYFNSKTNSDFDLGYISNFTQCLKITSTAQIRFDALKIEKGTESTDWCPAYDDYVMQSDLDDLKAQIEQLKSK